jgi:acyl transferase domain-containing protein
MTPQEASSLDPQHRGMMETTYHALENGTISVSLHVVPVFLTFVAAGIPLEQIAGSNTSVHVGCFTTDFLMQQFREPQQIPKYSATGTASSILSNRLSWFYNLHGPSLTVDTACSSSLVALDLACKGLWEGTSDTVWLSGHGEPQKS